MGFNNLNWEPPITNSEPNPEALKALKAEQSKQMPVWIKNENGTYSCSKCKTWIPEEQRHYARYCLHCGTRMGR